MMHKEESKAKISNSLMGHKVSEESRKKMSDSHKGIKHPMTEATKQKISESTKGRTTWIKGKHHRTYFIVCVSSID